ncbi:FecR domain-containing protein [Undibacterium flavidum]|uniref:FecR domain-containing protein n=1 Tax=Undibacterium flavidum TaxID=2762297 RepID=A0ABR6YC53_9BURK|nr:FecR domain-containing protein [Undibacterium flavidum]MBC3874124.1 FecR domain-containing protein [Undibacterium flavidum]
MYHRIRFNPKAKFLGIAFSMTCALLLTSNSQAEKIKGTPGTVKIETAGITYFALERDTLTTIAKRFTATPNNWEALGKLNQVRNDRAIPIGSGILIPAELLIEEASQASVVALAGNVKEISGKGAESRLAVGSVVLEGSQISTDKNSFVTLALPDDSRISVPSNSQVNLAKLRMTQFIKSPRTLIKLIQGRVESKVTPLTNNKGRFEVSSPLAIAGVRGTHFRVGVNDNGIGNEVLEGGVAVGSQAKPQALVLPAGKGNVVSSTGVGKPVDLLAAPILTEGFQLQERPVLQFAIQAVPGAVSYHAQISKDPENQNIIAEGVDKDLRFKFEGLDDGQYFIRVTAIDQNHLEGIPSTQAFVLKARPEPPFPLSPKHKVRTESVNFTWTQSSEAKTYRLQVASDALFKQINLDQANISATELSTDKLTLGKYFWRVASVIEKNGSVDQGPFSPVQSFQLLAPQAMNEVQDNGQNAMDFGWPAEPGQSFLVQISQDADFKKLYLSKDLEQASLSIPRPEAGVYFIRVRATDADRFIGNFSKPQKFEIQLRWTTSGGEPLESASGAVRPQKQ